MKNYEKQKREHLEALRDYCVNKYKRWNGAVNFSLNELITAYKPVPTENDGKIELDNSFSILELSSILKKSGFNIDVSAGVNKLGYNYLLLVIKPRNRAIYNLESGKSKPQIDGDFNMSIVELQKLLNDVDGKE